MSLQESFVSVCREHCGRKSLVVSDTITGRNREVLIASLKRNLWKGRSSSLEDEFRALFPSFPASPFFLLCLPERQRGCSENEFMNSLDSIWVMDPNTRESFEVTYWCDGFFFVFPAVGFKHISGTGLFSFEPIIFL